MGATTYPRIYQTILEEHLSKYRQMVFLSGPAAVATHCGLDELTSQVPIVVFDEIHKFGKWKTFLKGFFDLYEGKSRVIATGSAKMDVYKNLGAEVGIDEKTAKKWIKTLRQLYFGFEVRPWFKNIENAIRKTPKWFLRDWAQIEDPGKRAETMVACHLLKAVDCWTDLGFGEFSLGYLRNTRKEEVDFVVTRDNNPWFLVEVKKSDQKLSEALADYQRQTGAKFAFQVVLDMPYVDRSCFEITTPVVVPARTFLSQLV